MMFDITTWLLIMYTLFDIMSKIIFTLQCVVSLNVCSVNNIVISNFIYPLPCNFLSTNYTKCICLPKREILCIALY